MVSKIRNIPPAQLHTPQELLQGAEALVDSGDATLRRAAVLEAFSAIETYVESAVISTFEKRVYPTSLGEWLKKEMDDRLEKRLSLLEAVAIGHPMDLQLKKDFDEAKKIRNLVTHQGKKVSAPDARFVIQAIYKLLAYLGSTLELELALTNLKNYIESNSISIINESDAISLVCDYFGRNKPVITYNELPQYKFPKDKPQLKFELVIEFGTHRILLETRFIKANEAVKLFGQQVKLNSNTGAATFFDTVFKNLIDEVNTVLIPLNLTHGALIVLLDYGGKMPSEPSTRDPFIINRRHGKYSWGYYNYMKDLPGLESVTKYHDGRVHAIVINLNKPKEQDIVMAEKK